MALHFLYQAAFHDHLAVQLDRCQSKCCLIIFVRVSYLTRQMNFVQESGGGCTKNQISIYYYKISKLVIIKIRI